MRELAELHVLFGAGQVGYHLAQRLLAAGKRVRIVKRSSTEIPAGCEVVLGDAADPTFCLGATHGTATVYHCMNPPYDSRIWAEKVPLYMDNLIAAAGKAGARLVVLDNLYMLGKPKGLPFTEDTPMNPCSRKGEIRARAAERLFDAYRRGDVLVASGRASDFYGPRGTLTPLGDYFWPRVAAKKAVYSPYPLDAIHTYHYIPDVAAGLATIGCADPSAYGVAWMLPCVRAGTLRDLAGRLASKWGPDIDIKLAQLPRPLLKIVAFFMPLMYELDEMLYQWDEPFVVDDRRFRERFHIAPTEVDQAASNTVDWARQHYGTGTPRRTTLSQSTTH